MKQALFILSLMFLSMGTKAQTLTDKDLERIACEAIAEGVRHHSEDSLHYAVIVEVTDGKVENVLLFYYKDKLLGQANDITHSVLERINREAPNTSNSNPSSSTKDIQQIRHRDGWIPPAAR